MSPEEPSPESRAGIEIPRRLTRRQVELLRALCSPDFKNLKETAFDLGIGYQASKAYCRSIYKLLGWDHHERQGSQRMLVLFALAHRDILGIELPRQDQF